MAAAMPLLDVEIQCMQEAGFEVPLDLPVKLLQQLYPEHIVLTDAIRKNLSQLSPRMSAIDLLVQNLLEWAALNQHMQENPPKVDPIWSVPAFAEIATLKSKYSLLSFDLRDGNSNPYDRKVLSATFPERPVVLSITKRMQEKVQELCGISSQPARTNRLMQVRSNAEKNSYDQKVLISGILTILLPIRVENLTSNLCAQLDDLREPTMEAVRKLEEDSVNRRRNTRLGGNRA